jgi:hypothetical protein
MSQGSDSQKSNKYDLSEYFYAKSVCEDHPKLIALYDGLIDILEPYKHYTGAYEVLQSTYDCRGLLKLQLAYYQKVFKDKGRVTNE